MKALAVCASFVASASAATAGGGTSGLPWGVGRDACTALAVGKKASNDGSTMTTHTNDCLNCDFRLAKIPAQDHAANAVRPIFEIRLEYPRYVGDLRGDTYARKNLESHTDAHWNDTVPIGYIPQVEHTYSYLEGTYGFVNEHQLAMGESTCSAKLVAKPVSAGGHALLEMAELTRLGMERCKTARCAIKTMGGLAEEYGYYGSDWKSDEAGMQLESGEAVTVTDPHEAWLFHILPDDTGKSAVWAAQRVPDDHFSIIANDFMIQEMDLKDSDYFLASDNMLPVARRNGFWDPKRDGPFNFVKAFTSGHAHERYCSRRVWRAFQMVAPSLSLDPDAHIVDLPFSVKVEKPLTPADLMAIQRDHYEGTPYDNTRGMMAGPYGNPNRYDAGTGEGDASLDTLNSGTFERPISMFRASFSYVAHSRSMLPDPVGAMMWWGQYAPHASVYLPVYVAAPVPATLSTGSLYHFSRDASWWAFAAVGNWAERMYKFIMMDVRQQQQYFESKALDAQAGLEARAASLLADHGPKASAEHLGKAVEQHTTSVIDGWWNLFGHLITKYHDGYSFSDLSQPTLNPEKLFYPLWWLKAVGYFDTTHTHTSEDVTCVPASEPTATHIKADPTVAKAIEGAGFGPDAVNTAQVLPAPPRVNANGPLEAQPGFVSTVLLVGFAFTAGVVLGGKWHRHKEWFDLDQSPASRRDQHYE